jgi:hypothetical protein
METRSHIARGEWIGGTVALAAFVAWLWSGGLAAQSPRPAIGFTA